ncbi:MAG: triose-phosphate isomerase [Rhizobiaceae bacterium]
MTSEPNFLIAGNWKMNGLQSSLAELDEMVSGVQGESHGDSAADMVVCVPSSLLIPAVQKCNGTPVEIGGQDCHTNVSGAHTGDISAEMIADTGAKWIITGHSERRTDHGETNEEIKAKSEAVQRAGIIPIICIGETGDEREQGRTLAVLKAQLDGSLTEPADFVVAYEPVWAIGTGLVPTIDDITEAHKFIRGYLIERYGAKGADVRILYGGSVKPGNAAEILSVANVNGALVGGASLKAEDILGIWRATP